jgi:hypothetical protein
MKELSGRIVLCGVTVGVVMCLAGCPKNNPAVDRVITPPKGDASNPEYLKSMQATPRPGSPSGSATGSPTGSATGSPGSR